MNITYDFFINIRRTKFKFYLKRDFIFIFIFIIWELYFDIDLFYILCNIYKVIQIVPQSVTQSLASMHMTLNMDSCLFVSFPTFIDASATCTLSCLLYFHHDFFVLELSIHSESEKNLSSPSTPFEKHIAMQSSLPAFLTLAQ